MSFCVTSMIKTMTKCRKNAKITKRKNSRLTKNIFSGFLNWIFGHLQSSDDENKIAIREISIRAIQKLSDLDHVEIVIQILKFTVQISTMMKCIFPCGIVSRDSTTAADQRPRIQHLSCGSCWITRLTASVRFPASVNRLSEWLSKNLTGWLKRDH